MTDESCRTCRYWRRTLKKQKGGTCSAWQPQDYHQKRGRGRSRFIAYGGGGVFTDEDQWCARWKCNHSETPNSSGGDHE